MSKQTIYKCDKCGKKGIGFGNAENCIELFQVKLTAETYPLRSSRYLPTQHEVDWCKECCIKADLAGSKVERATSATQAPERTLDDVIRDIVHDALNNV